MLRATPRNDVIGSSTVALGGIGNPLVTKLGSVSDPSKKQLGGLVLIGFDKAVPAPSDANVEGELLVRKINSRYRAGISPTAHAVWLLDEKDEALLGTAFQAAIEKLRGLPGVKYVQAVDVRSTPDELAQLDKAITGETPKWLWALGGIAVAGVVLTFLRSRRK